MNTKNVCNRLGLTPKGLRVYEEKGLVVPARNENGYRNYSERDILRLREILLLKDLGFSLQDIKGLQDKSIDDEHIFVRSLYLQKQAINKKIQVLKNIERTLEESIDKVLNDEMNKQLYLNAMGKTLDNNKRTMSSWRDQWNFDTWAITYDESLTNNNDELELFKDYSRVLEEVRKEIATTSCQRILDLGCGTGNLTGRYSQQVEVYGIDQSLEMLLQCKEKYPKMKVKLGNFLDETYIEGVKFDCIVTTYAFHHLTEAEKEKAIDYMLGALKPEGKIVIGDLMFLNEEKRKEKEQEFIARGREDLWETIEEEFYGDVEKLKTYIDKKGIGFKYKHLVNFTWMIVIQG
ncbi:MerR family transcriptional regulator [Alkaliphilus serpentinus]|uniref:MerR family transcriptional regulator n=1 Tax=Alkaliphilus serpentinus TaxID=1482731 RepID=A0A833HL23_9FIRM|nr:MerR family transcriptional regulator [Alkaliphilus serpentinus]KAB3524890.1 MerR family transcriptional regulator [Alkaliphilus serpentinus]